MAITLTITPPGLQVVGAGGYEVLSNGLQPGNKQQRRDWAKSPYIAGAALLSSVADIVTGTVDIEVFGSSRADLLTKVDALIDAFEQLSYVMAFDLDGTAWSWNCYRADIVLDMEFPMYLGNLTTVHFSFPRDPTPAAGPF